MSQLPVSRKALLEQRAKKTRTGNYISSASRGGLSWIGGRLLAAEKLHGVRPEPQAWSARF
jgi:hypothetical protein